MSVGLKPNCIFRPMQADDLDAILQIEPTIYSHPWTRGNFSDSLKAGHIAWVMLLDNAVVGYSLMSVVLDEAELLNLSIAASCQKQGHGYALLAQVLDSAKAQSVTHLFLEVRKSNISAIALYEKMGFVEVSVRRGYYPSAEGREDAVIMRLIL